MSVVLVGGRVAGGHDGGPMPEGGIAIKKGKLRGIESFGMMCSIEDVYKRQGERALSVV